MGTIHYGEVSEASVGYTLKYINKPKRIPLHRNDDRQPEFALMSKGLGANYLTPAAEKYHTADIFNRMCMTLKDGKKIAMPRYYKDKIYTESQRAQIASWSKQKAQEREAKDRKAYGPKYDRDKNEANIAAFKKHNKQATKRGSL